MTDDEAKELLAKLENHYNEPVKPISEYCEAFRTWADCIQKAKDNGKDRFYYAEYLPDILRDIRKSSLLWRLLYGGQKLRKTPCPEHKGRWSGIPFEKLECGCDLIGWLPEDEDKYSQDTPHKVVQIVENNCGEQPMIVDLGELIKKGKL